MPKMGESGEVVAPHVHLLHERCDRVNESLGFQYAMYLVNAAIRVRNMFEYRSRNHDIKIVLRERDVVSITDQLRQLTNSDIAINDVTARRSFDLSITRTQDQSLWCMT